MSPTVQNCNAPPQSRRERPQIKASPVQTCTDPIGINRIYRQVASCVVDDFGVTPAELAFGSRGSPRAALARQLAMYLCHVGFSLSFETIGKLFRRDRTTVAYACRVIEERRDDIWFDCRLAVLEHVCDAARSKECAR